MPFYRGTSLDDLLVGSAFDDVIAGYDGADLIDDGGSGADELIGGRGNDQYFVRTTRASVIEFVGEGYDTVNTTLGRYELPANVERLVYAGSGAFVGLGNALDNDIVGGAGTDSLAGGDGNDLLRGGAGSDLLDGQAGLDTMIGGTGSDFYYVDSTGDSIIENTNEGTDRAIVSRAVGIYTLPANIEQLQNAGSQLFYGYGNTVDNLMVGGTGQDWLFGYEGADTLVGGAGDDRLYGGAGAANTVIGGTGDDYYFVESAGDTIVENAGEGTDRILTALGRYQLTANVENLFYTGTGGFSGIGNSLANIIFGGSGNDELDGAGGPDSLYGRAGNDTYYVRDRYALIFETAGEGTDTIVALSHDNFVLSSNVENFVSRAYFSVGVVGNDLDNHIAGTVARTVSVTPSGFITDNPGNVLSGGGGNDTIVGGAADDTLTGGTGNDRLDSGAGYDVARYSGLASGYFIAVEGAGYRIIDTTLADGDDGSDFLLNVEAVRFGNGTTQSLPPVGMGSPLPSGADINFLPTKGSGLPLILPDISSLDETQFGSRVDHALALTADVLRDGQMAGQPPQDSLHSHWMLF